MKLLNKLVLEISGWFDEVRADKRAGKITSEQAEERLELVLSATLDLLALRGKLANYSKELEVALVPTLKRVESDPEMTMEFYKAYKKLRTKMSAIEILWNGSAEIVFFPLPPEADFLTANSKERFINNVDFTDTESRLKGLLAAGDDLIFEMNFMYAVRSNTFVRYMKDHLLRFKQFIFVVAMLLNFNFCISVVNKGTGRNAVDNAISFDLTYVLGVILMCGQLVMFVYLFFVVTPVEANRILSQAKVDIKNERPPRNPEALMGLVFVSIFYFLVAAVHVTVFGFEVSYHLITFSVAVSQLPTVSFKRPNLS